MSVKSMRRILWVALLATLPIPYWVMEGGWVPTVWLFEVAAFTLAVLLSEGGSITALLSGLFVLEAIAAAAVLYLIARLAARLLHQALPANLRGAAVGALVLLLFAASLASIYSTPLVANGQPTNLVRLLT